MGVIGKGIDKGGLRAFEQAVDGNKCSESGTQGHIRLGGFNRIPRKRNARVLERVDGKAVHDAIKRELNRRA